MDVLDGDIENTQEQNKTKEEEVYTQNVRLDVAWTNFWLDADIFVYYYIHIYGKQYNR